MNFEANIRQLLTLFSEEVDELLFNGYSTAFALESGQMKVVKSHFTSEDSYIDFLQEFSQLQGVRLDPYQPFAGGQFQAGAYRWHCILPPISQCGPIFSLRKNRFLELEIDHFTYKREVFDRLEKAIREDKSLLIFGPTGSGKTSLLTVLLQKYCASERIIILETLAEIPQLNPKWVRLVERQPDLEQRGEVRLPSLYKQVLRLRPDRIIVGELRGEELSVFLNALHSGHRGSWTTLHASDPQQAFKRFKALINEYSTEKFEDCLENLCFVQLARGKPPIIQSLLFANEINY
ncbi:MAG: Flp pilus assembly complex ATPase component TadA [Oligoflexales bacterium]|nr:Flp pilus assembly complex ATPase component TadA [Oligoflexales bacterium]